MYWPQFGGAGWWWAAWQAGLWASAPGYPRGAGAVAGQQRAPQGWAGYPPSEVCGPQGEPLVLLARQPSENPPHRLMTGSGSQSLGKSNKGNKLSFPTWLAGMSSTTCWSGHARYNKKVLYTCCRVQKSVQNVFWMLLMVHISGPRTLFQTCSQESLF